jgi:hypothetical protein
VYAIKNVVLLNDYELKIDSLGTVVQHSDLPWKFLFFKRKQGGSTGIEGISQEKSS